MKPSPITVGFCENGAGYGGAIISLAAMLPHLSDEFTPFLYTGLGSEPYRQLQRLAKWTHVAPVSVLDQERLKARGIPLASRIDNVVNLLPYVLKYYRAFKKHGIRIVYLNNDANCNIAAAVAASLAGLPTVLHARGFHADTRGTRWVLSRLAHCIPVSQAVRTELIGLGLAPEKCTVVPEGLDLASFHPIAPCARVRAELGLNGSEPVITLVGGLIDWKGQDVLLDAAPRIFERFPDARILLVGSPYGREDSYAQLIARRVAQPELAGRVRLLGGRADIPELLSISSVVIHASTLPEPFGRTFLEGMAVGRPVIASNEGGPLDVIDHETDGLLVAPRDPALLADAVVRILGDAALAQKLATNGAAKARRFSIENHTEAVAAVLRAVALDSARPRAP